MRCIILSLLASIALPGIHASADAGVKTETGQIRNASFRIDVPEPWNGDVIVYLRGYSLEPPTFDRSTPNPFQQAFLDKGYAFIQSGYSSGGWAIRESIEDTQALVQHFKREHVSVKNVYLVGHSMGGFSVMLMLERLPKAYDGGLAMCAPLGSAATFLGRRAFDVRLVFDAHFPGHFTPLDKPESPKPGTFPAVLAALDASPDRAQAVRRFADLNTNRELAQAVVLYTHVLADIHKDAQGNPFDNRNVVYQGAADDVKVNEIVTRYQAQARAAAYLRAEQSATGRLKRPLVALQNADDPIVPAWVGNVYAELVASQADNPAPFVQTYVSRSGHCAITPDEAIAAFSTLTASR